MRNISGLVARRDHVVELASDEAVLRRAEHRRRRARAPADRAVRVDAQDRVRLGIQQGPEASLAGPDGTGLVEGPGRVGQARDRLLALDGTCSERAQELEQLDVVLEEQRPSRQDGSERGDAATFGDEIDR